MVDLQFKEGSMVAYPGQGVAEILGVADKTLGKQTITFYELRMLETDIKIMVPIHKATQVGLRALVTPADIDKLLAVMKMRDVVFDKQTWKRRYGVLV